MEDPVSMKTEVLAQRLDVSYRKAKEIQKKLRAAGTPDEGK